MTEDENNENKDNRTDEQKEALNEMLSYFAADDSGEEEEPVVEFTDVSNNSEKSDNSDNSDNAENEPVSKPAENSEQKKFVPDDGNKSNISLEPGKSFEIDDSSPAKDSDDVENQNDDNNDDPFSTSNISPDTDSPMASGNDGDGNITQKDMDEFNDFLGAKIEAIAKEDATQNQQNFTTNSAAPENNANTGNAGNPGYNVPPSNDGNQNNQNMNQGGFENSNPAGGNNEEEAEDEGDFKANPKVSYADLTKTAPKMNKNLISTIIVVTILIGIVIVAFFPSLLQRKKNKDTQNSKNEVQNTVLEDFKGKRRQKGQKDTSSNSLINYDEIGESEGVTDSGTQSGNQNQTSNQESKNGEKQNQTPVSQPKVEKPQQNVYTGSGSGGGTTVEVPNTRFDSLQGKSISGIKGLTGTRSNYATDYNKTIEYNAQVAEENNSRYTSGALPSKEEYTSKLLSTAMGDTRSSYEKTNDQSGKSGFHTNGYDKAGDNNWLALNTLWEGSIFEVALSTAINTDLPGEVNGIVTRNVYSSQDGRYLLIPQNSKILGTYNSSITYGQNRIQVAWKKIIRPDGYEINLGNMNATDEQGAAGVKGFVNDHPMAYVKAIALMSVFSIANGEFSSQLENTDNTYVQNVLADSQEVVNTLGEKLIDRAMDVQPTLKKKAGKTIVNVYVNQTLEIPPYEEIPPVTETYKRR